MTSAARLAGTTLSTTARHEAVTVSWVGSVTYLSGLGKFETGAAEGTRTPDPRFTKAVLYQLSYRGIRRP